MHSNMETRFERVRQVGAGAFGTVFLARDLETGENVALKVLDHGTDLRRFEREVEALASLSHPGIVSYVAHGFDNRGRACLAMEWLEGETLADRLERGVLSLEETSQLGLRVADALGSALFANVMHRDLKPANLFLPGSDVAQAKILDFGLARSARHERTSLTNTGGQVGTPTYMSPEQAHGEKGLTHRSDVFALGIVLYECLTGHLPFHERTAVATMMKICFAEPRPVESRRAGIPPELSHLVRRMLEKQPSARPSYAQIRGVLASLPMATRAASMPARAPGMPAHSGAFARPSLHARRELRVMCSLFVGASALNSLRSEAHLSQVLADHAAHCQRLEDGTRVILADESVSPSDQALSAAQCAAALRRYEPKVSMALCTGLTSASGQEPGAELVERGRRLLDQAPAGHVLLDASSARMVSARFDLSETPDGIRLLEERTTIQPPQGASGRLTRFVGRTRELLQLEMLMQECIDESSPRSVLITGPAGAGKSRLRHELRRRLEDAEGEQTWQVLEGRADSLGQVVRFGALRPALLDHAGILGGDKPQAQQAKLLRCIERYMEPEESLEIAEFLGEMLGLRFADEGRESLASARRDPQLMADRMLAAWLRFIDGMCQRGPVLFVVEDLHWADAASLRFLQAARQSTSDRPFMWVAFARPVVHETFPHLREDRELDELRLLRLGPRPCHLMLDDLLGKLGSKALRERVVALADGNPLFLEELARACRERPGRPDLPVTVLGVLQARIDRLEPDTKLVLRAACIFGRNFTRQGLGTVLEAHATRLDLEEQLALLEQHAILEQRASAGPGHYRFRHDLIGEAAYRLLTQADRAAGHTLVGEWLEQGPRPIPALVAEHFDRGDQQQRAIPWYLAAAQQALEVGTTEEVIRLGRRCVECGAGGEPLGRVASLIAEAASWQGDEPSSQHWAALARQLLDSTDPAWWRATQVAAISASRCGDSKVKDLVEEMIERSADGPWDADRAMAVAYVAVEAFDRVGSEQGTRLLSLRPQALAEALEGRPEGCFALADSCYRRAIGDTAGEIRAAERAVATFRSVGAMRNLIDALSAEGLGLVELGQMEQAERQLREARMLAERTGSNLHVHAANGMLAVALRRRGDYAAARRLLTEASEAFGRLQIPFFESLSRANLALVEAATENWHAAREAARRAVELQPSDARAWSCALATSSYIHTRMGELDVAYEQARQAIDVVRQHELLSDVAIVWVAWLEVLVARGDHDAAREAATLVMGQLTRRASSLRDTGERRLFLEAVPEHRRIVELADQLCA